MFGDQVLLDFYFGYIERYKTFNLHIFHERASDQTHYGSVV
jgi:hypothetical protein